MALSPEELKALAEKNGQGGTATATTNNDEALKKAEEGRLAAEARAADAEFNASFTQFSSTYPFASEHKDDIRAKVNSGYSVEDAVISTLTKEKKLKTADEIAKENNRGEGMGGSANNGNMARQNDSTKEPTLEEAAKAFQDAEARGEIFFN